MADEALRKDLDALKEDISKMREDMVQLAATMKMVAGEKAAGAAAGAKERANQYRDEFAGKVEAAMGQGKKVVDEVDSQIGQHPFSTVLTAFGLGFAIAKLMEMGNRR